MEIINEVRLTTGKTLDHLKITSSDFLDRVSGRSTCPKCSRSRKYFCYTCYVPMVEIADRIPRLKLPLKIDIIKHPKEVDGKSTAMHAAVVAPDDVSIYTYPNFPDYDKTKVLLVFPGKDSLSLQQIAKKFSLPLATDVNNAAQQLSDIRQPCSFPFERVIFIDSTWNQVRGIRKDERLQGIQRVELTDRESCFWRFQRGKPRTYLSTIEAMYYFLVDVHTMFICPDYRGEYDDLLFFFRYMFRKIHTLYDPAKLRVHDPRFNGHQLK